MEASDDILQSRAASDDAAFELLYRRYAERVRLVAWRLSRHSGTSEDLANEAWCRAFRLRSTYDAGRPFFGWVCGILQNVWREHARSNRPLGDDASVHFHADPTEIPDPEDLDAAISQAEILAALNDCVGRLSDDDQLLVRLRFFENQTLRVIAQRLKLAEATVRATRLPAVMDKIQRCLSAKGIRSDIFSFSAAQDAAPNQYLGEEQ